MGRRRRRRRSQLHARHVRRTSSTGSSSRSFALSDDLLPRVTVNSSASMSISDYGDASRARAGYAWRLLPALRVRRLCARPSRHHRTPVASVTAVSRPPIPAFHCRWRHLSRRMPAQSSDLWLQRRALVSTSMLIGGLFLRAEWEYRPLHLAGRHQHQHRARRPRLQVLIARAAAPSAPLTDLPPPVALSPRRRSGGA